MKKSSFLLMGILSLSLLPTGSISFNAQEISERSVEPGSYNQYGDPSTVTFRKTIRGTSYLSCSNQSMQNVMFPNSGAWYNLRVLNYFQSPYTVSNITIKDPLNDANIDASGLTIADMTVEHNNGNAGLATVQGDLTTTGVTFTDTTGGVSTPLVLAPGDSIGISFDLSDTDADHLATQIDSSAVLTFDATDGTTTQSYTITDTNVDIPRDPTSTCPNTGGGSGIGTGGGSHHSGGGSNGNAGGGSFTTVSPDGNTTEGKDTTTSSDSTSNDLASTNTEGSKTSAKWGSEEATTTSTTDSTENKVVDETNEAGKTPVIWEM